MDLINKCHSCEGRNDINVKFDLPIKFMVEPLKQNTMIYGTGRKELGNKYIPNEKCPNCVS